MQNNNKAHSFIACSSTHEYLGLVILSCLQEKEHAQLQSHIKMEVPG